MDIVSFLGNYSEHFIYAGLFLLLYEKIPGFNGLRVPARFAMEITLFLAALGGLGVARLRESHARIARVAMPVLVLMSLAEASTMPLRMNVAMEGEAPWSLPESLHRGPTPRGDAGESLSGRR